MRPKVKITEADLCRPVVAYLSSQYWTVYQEVQLHQYGKIADLVAVRAGVIWVLEAKLSLSISVIEQAQEWRHRANYVSVVTPHRRGYTGQKILLALGIGALQVDRLYDGGIDPDAYVTDFVKPAFFRLRPAQRDNWISGLRPEQISGKFGEAGNAQGKRYTPYKGTIERVKAYLKQVGEATMADIVAAIDYHYCNETSAKQSISKALLEWEKCAKRRKVGKQWLYSLI